MIEEIVIIGGGIAGLCAAIRLTELQIKPLLLEGGGYPAHKVCGEFFSPECLPQLRKWSVTPTPLHQAYLRTTSRSFQFSFPQPAGGLSHIQADPSLARYAIKQGVKILTQTQVKAFYPKEKTKDLHRIELANGGIIYSKAVIMATGRIPGYRQTKHNIKYIGLKAHFKKIPIDHALEMFFLPHAYVGLASIEDQKYNVACLAKRSAVERYQSPDSFMQHLALQHPLLNTYLTQGEKLFSNWMTTSVPAFGFKQTPRWQDVYFIGDAASTIPPACGNGLSMAIAGGCLVAEYAIKHQSDTFKKEWRRRCASQLFWGKLFHLALLHSPLANPLIQAASCYPSLAHQFFNLTRHPSQ